MTLFSVSSWRSLRPRPLQRGFFRALAAFALAPLFLAGCAQGPVHSTVSQNQQPALPEQQLADFFATDCADIWRLSGPHIEANPLYWLRGIECAGRLGPAEARAEARAWPGDNWQETFKRGILLANAKITPVERRDFFTRLEEMAPQIPAHVRPLYQVWRDGQAAQLQLASERSRYSKLQQSTDLELDTLREQQQRLHTQLNLTTRKLENLTDIERQLSTRKSAGGYLQDPEHPADSVKSQEGSAVNKESAPAKEEAKP
ncbi:two-component system QseEF-associated lipoprotein QseG [Franconibacter helveticus 513]|uniref:two-component system QseEF-associated lipoprotein QseG n=1 Tax=Franconibacter helveticus TaxID=357240 RepID=UPI00041D985A|nr:two-component system QseEF-associated lipoprotein QseG [Franconibacter helveticus]MDU6925907.1 two-component system QseEF-associated lipoprotein QseG [Franconibacter helveticus]